MTYWRVAITFISPKSGYNIIQYIRIPPALNILLPGLVTRCSGVVRLRRRRIPRLVGRHRRLRDLGRLRDEQRIHAREADTGDGGNLPARPVRLWGQRSLCSGMAMLQGRSYMFGAVLDSAGLFGAPGPEDSRRRAAGARRVGRAAASARRFMVLTLFAD